MMPHQGREPTQITSLAVSGSGYGDRLTRGHVEADRMLQPPTVGAFG
jgi:hypothetical protein